MTKRPDPITRREFIRRSALAGGATLAAAGVAGFPFGTAAAKAAKAGPSILDVAAKEAPIDHVVVLMMENRSFDHYLGWLARDVEFLEAGRSRYGGGFRVNGDTRERYRTPDGAEHATYYLPTKQGEANAYRGCDHPDPGHGWEQGRVQRDGGFLATGSGNDDYALGYYLSDDVPLYANLARRFTTFDRYHCSVLGPTYPNREYLHSAQSGGMKDNSTSDSGGFDWTTIWDRLQTAGVDAAYYFADLPVTALWGPRLLGVTRHLERYFADCAAGTLPKVTFLDPAFTTGFRTDDHPFADIRAGQRYVFDLLRAFVDSPHWEKGAFIVTYDEWGGFFDHVPPPMLPDDRTSANDEDNFAQAGFRVPTLLASPFAQPGFVDHRLYDHTSILRFIEWRFLGAPPEGPGKNGDSWFLTKRDRTALNIGASLRAANPDPQVQLETVPQIPVASPPCEGDATDGLPGASEMHAFEHSLEQGYFERVGYPVRLQPVPTP